MLKTHIGQLEKFKEILISKYGDERVDMEIPTADNYKSMEHVNVTIHYPEILITNSYKQKHKIRDLYLTFTISCSWSASSSYNKRILTISSILTCSRGTLTSIEYAKNYYHSHCGNSFCLGYSELRDFLNEVAYTGLNSDNFEFFTYILDDYLKWESLEGGPYRKIENLTNITSRTYRANANIRSSDIDTEGIIKYFIDNNIELPIINNYETLTFHAEEPINILTPIVYRNKELEELIKKYLLDTYDIDGLIHKGFIHAPDNYLYHIEMIETGEYEVVRTFDNEILFKGNMLPTNVIEPVRIAGDMDYEKIVEESIVNNIVIEIINKELNNKLRDLWKEKQKEYYQSW